MAYRKKTLGLIERILATASSGGTLNLANNSRTYQQITGTLSHTVVLPQANAASPNECPIGLQFTVLNRSTQAITVNYFGGSLAKSISANSQATFILIDNSTSAGSWDVSNEASSGGGTALTAEQKLAVIAALGTAYYKDSNVLTNTLKVNPEEIGGDFWRSKSNMLITNGLRNHALVSHNGFLYSVGGDDGGGPGGVSQLWFYSFNDDNNFWIAKANLPAIRNGIGAFSLSGSLIAAGGRTTSTNTTNTIFSYNDATDIWSTLTPTLPTAKSVMPSNMVMDGFGYFVGGYVTGGATSADVSAYNISGQFSCARATLPAVRYDGAGLVGPKYLHYAAGLDASPSRVTTAYAFDTVSNSWKSTSAYPQARNGSPAFSALGRGYTPSGYTNAGPPLSTQGYVYNFELDLWSTSVSPISLARYDAPAGGSEHNGYGYALGGSTSAGPLTNTVECYQPFSFFNLNITNKSLAAPTSVYVAAAINNVVGNLPARMRTDGDAWKYFKTNKDSVAKTGETLSEKFSEYGQMYIAGGDDAVSTAYSTVEFYNPVSNTYIARASMSANVRGAQCFKLDGYGHVTGGDPVSSGATNVNRRYDEEANSWTTKAVLPASKDFGAGYHLNGYGYAVAGLNGGTVTTNYKYDSSLDSWATKTPITSAAATVNGAVLFGLGYVVNGSSTGSFGNNQNLNQQYNDILDSWATKTGSTNGRTAPATFAINNYLYIGGGYYSGTFSNNSVEKYDPVTDSWSPSGSLGSSRTAIGANTSSGFGYAFGGQVGTAPSPYTDKYNVDNKTSSLVSNLSVNRTFISSNFTPSPYRNYELQIGLPTYLAAAGSWTPVTMAPLNIQDESPGNLAGYYVGGPNASVISYILNLESNAWRRIGDTTAIFDNSGAASLGGRGYMWGTNGVTTTTNVLNPETWTWTTGAARATALLASKGCSLDGFIFSMRGYNGSVATTTVQKFTESTNTWSNVGNTTTAGYTSGVGAALGYLYTSGTVGGDTTVERYNPVDNTKVNVTAYPLSVGYMAFHGHLGSIWGLAGFNGSNFANVYEYKPDQNVWYSRPSLGTARNSVGHGSFGSDFIVGAGSGTSVHEKYTSAIKNVVLGAGLRID